MNHATIIFLALAAVSGGEAGGPEVFAPGVISGQHDVDAATFLPDGNTVYFDRSDDRGSTIMVSHRAPGGAWSEPKVASFSGTWSDKDSAMAPDGAFLIFDSNRPAAPGGKAIDLVCADGTVREGQGDQLWRVNRIGKGWGNPVRLPGSVNDRARIYSPSVVRDGSVYLQRPDPRSRTFHLVRSQYRGGAYEAPIPVAIGPEEADERDPAVSADESFMVFSANYAAKGTPNRLYIVFREKSGWGKPIDLGDAVNHDGAEGPHLGADGTSVYFDSTAPVAGQTAQLSRIWKLDLSPWLAARKAAP